MAAAENVVVVFARAPRPGSVKTRLVPPFSHQEACEIHLALLGDVLERASRPAAGSAKLVLAWSEPTDTAAALGALPDGVEVETQPAGDLGERMALCVQSRLRAGARKVVILGSDAPTLPEDHLASAFGALDRSDVVLGPAEDGGYYLVGTSRLHPDLFRDVPWGTAQVLEVTRRRLRRAGLRWSELGVWHDVDTPADVARVWKELLRLKEKRSAELPPRTYRTLARLAPGRAPL